MHEHDASAYARASVEHDAPAHATDGRTLRTHALTQMHSPREIIFRNASRAGGLNDSSRLTARKLAVTVRSVSA